METYNQLQFIPNEMLHQLIVPLKSKKIPKFHIKWLPGY
ncbi:hypothetical protein T4C_11120 [Trichinella pseudospiralis]|uniref:Uncharacterized protein n=1 Tax=Trichinella pseudospiralis TaxID=6337 RepID=A0A0V1GRL9_TRIPS|nr:hypothetical protein T4C_11120 [Trichinella pseudospiralis]